MCMCSSAAPRQAPATNSSRRFRHTARCSGHCCTGNNITNHVAYLVSDLSAARDRLTAADFVAISDPKPAVAYGGSAIQFFMSPICSVVELIEAPGHQHQDETVHGPPPVA